MGGVLSDDVASGIISRWREDELLLHKIVEEGRHVALDVGVASRDFHEELARGRATVDRSPDACGSAGQQPQELAVVQQHVSVDEDRIDRRVMDRTDGVIQAAHSSCTAPAAASRSS